MEAGHIAPYEGPGNCPVFPVRKGPDKGRLIHDLRATNSLAQEILSASPGPPDLAGLPSSFRYLSVIDLKDAFFQIPIDPKFYPYFTFTVPAELSGAPRTRYAWKVLPQGFKNSPALFEAFLSQALAPFGKKYPGHRLLQYMDDLLLALEGETSHHQAQESLLETLRQARLPISEEKVQTSRRRPGHLFRPNPPSGQGPL